MYKILSIVLLLAISHPPKLSSQPTDSLDLKSVFNKIVIHLKNRLSKETTVSRFPHSYNMSSGEITVPSSDWRSGFYPGILWYMYDYTRDPYWRRNAEKWTEVLEMEKYNTRTHDLGFMINNSFGNGFRLTKNPNYKGVLIQAAKSLATRYNEKVGCIRSWDHGKWEYPVIIDNMMNLELLFEAAKISGNKRFYEIALSHAKNTLKNQYREDGSSYHVVNYNSKTGEVISRETSQGYSDESAWARGQAWGLYGFTLAYRETKEIIFLEQAEKIANYFLKNLPEDKIPVWDFHAPKSQYELKDASASAIAASSLLELSLYSKKNRSQYYTTAKEILETLSSPAFFANEKTNGNFLLKHSVGNKPLNKEIDAPTIYADYYFLEALLKLNAITTKEFDK